MRFFKGATMPYDLEKGLVEKSLLSVSSLVRARESGGEPRLQPIIDTFYDIKALKPCRYPEHRHNAFEIILVVQGSYQCALNGKALKLSEGDALIVQPGDAHMDMLEAGLRYYGIGFFLRDSLAPGETPMVFGKSAGAEAQAVRKAGELIGGEAAQMLREKESAGPCSCQIMGGLLSCAFWKLVRAIPRKQLAKELLSSAKDEDFRRSLLEVMESRMEGGFDLEELARSIGMSPSSLSHKTKEAFNLSPAKLLSLLKIDKAQSMILSTSLSLKEISRLLGFKNQYHFSKVFKERTGQSPSGYRRAEEL